MDPLSIGTGLASAAGGLASLFGNKKKSNPANAANKYLQQIPGMTLPFYADYINEGKGFMPGYDQMLSELSNDPGAFYNKIGSGYKESPGYAFKLREGLGAAGNAAAAGGMLGTPMHQEQATGVAEGIANQDFMDYLNSVLGIFGQGMQGQENAINRGFDASKGFGDIVGNTLGSSADVAFKGKAGQNASRAQGWSNLASGLASAAPWFSNANTMPSRSYG